MPEKKALIITGNLVQDHEFIYPFYRLLEDGFEVDTCINEGKEVTGILGTKIPPNKDAKIKLIDDCSVEDYNILIIPGGVKSMEKVRQNKKLFNLSLSLTRQEKQLGAFVVELNY